MMTAVPQQPIVSSVLQGNDDDNNNNNNNNNRRTFYRGFTDQGVSTRSFLCRLPLSDVSSDVTEDLDELGQQFKELVEVRDRRFGFQVFRGCFIASEAVKAMVASGLVTSHKEAVRLGTELQLRGLFEHVTQDHYFTNRYLFFRFIIPDLHQKAQRFREIVKVQDHKYRLRTYKKSFTAVEAITAMMEHKLAESIDDAIELGRELQYHNFFEAINKRGIMMQDYYFSDTKKLFFRFTTSKSSIPHGDCANSSRHGGDTLSCFSYNHYQTHDESYSSGMNYDLTHDLDRFVELFQQSVPLKDCNFVQQQQDGNNNNSHSHKDPKTSTIVYKNCFNGSEAVDAMLDCGLAATRQEAVGIGKALQAAGLFGCVADTTSHDGNNVNNIGFMDDPNLYYRYIGTDQIDIDWNEIDVSKYQVLLSTSKGNKELNDKNDDKNNKKTRSYRKKKEEKQKEHDKRRRHSVF